MALTEETKKASLLTEFPNMKKPFERNIDDSTTWVKLDQVGKGDHTILGGNLFLRYCPKYIQGIDL